MGTKYVGFGRLKEVEREVAERERAREAEAAPLPRPVPPGDTVPSSSTVPPNNTVSPDVTVPPQHTEPVRGNTVPVHSTVPAAGTVLPDNTVPLRDRLEVVPGYTRVPNTVMDSLLRTLDPIQQSVYLRLYRLSHGFGSETCKVGYKALQSACNIGRTSVQKAIDALEARGYVERLEVENSAAARADRGSVYRVVAPGFGVSQDNTVSRRGTVSPRNTVSPDGRIKRDTKNMNKGAPVAVAPAPEISVYDVRRIAARFRELHHGEAEYTKDKLKADVRTALIGEGREPDDRLIDEALNPS
jgi:hypothetical protein